MKKIVLGLAVAASFNVHAISVNIKPTAACKSNTECMKIVTDMEKKAEDKLPSVGLDKYADGVSNSVALAGRDNSDYSDNFSLFAAKVGLGVGIDDDLSDASDSSKINGFGVQSTMQVGVNMSVLPVDKVGPIELKRLDVFGSAFSQTTDQKMDDGTAEGEVSSFGLSARYLLVEGKDVLPGYMLEWGGLHVHGGYRRSNMNIKLNQDIDSKDNDAEFKNAEATFEMDSTVDSFSLDLSTYVRFLYVFTLYGGLGADMNSGDTSIELSGKGDLHAKSGMITGKVGEVELDDDTDGAATGFVPRYFAGLQVNVPFVRVYAQVNKAASEDVTAMQFGVKLLY